MRLGFLFGMGGVSGQEREIPRGGEKRPSGRRRGALADLRVLAGNRPFFSLSISPTAGEMG